LILESTQELTEDQAGKVFTMRKFSEIEAKEIVGMVALLKTSRETG
jgi:hypothetical protein